MNLGEGPERPDGPKDPYDPEPAGDRDVEVTDTPAVPIAGNVEDNDPLLMAALIEAKVSPTPKNHRRVAELYQRHGILDLAYDHLAAAARLAPREATTQDSLARLWGAWGLPDIGLGAAYRAVAYAPDSPQARNTLGMLLQSIGRHSYARRSYEEGLALDGTAAYILNNLCYLSYVEEKFGAAIAACQAAIDSDSSLVEAYNNLALVYFATNEDELGRAALTASGAHSTALYNLGIAHLARGDHAEAAAVFARASRAKPSWAAPRQRVSQALSHSSTRPGGQ